MAQPAHLRLRRRPRQGRPEPAGGRAIAPDGTAGATLPAAARRIARTVAAPHADAVDRDGRFPAEAVAALRSAGLLGAAVPLARGGQGASFAAIVAACYELGQGCSSTALIFAMHQIQLFCLLRHAGPWHDAFLERVAREQLLLASATTEAGSGGDVRRSDVAVALAGGRAALTKRGCVISYAQHADAVLLTARRAPDAAPSDQVVVVAECPQCRLEPRAAWDTLGMRGTCSAGYDLTLDVDPAQILPDPYADIAARTMVPVSHTTWAAAWLGIATAACARARAAVRRRTVPGAPTLPPGALRLSETLGRLQSLRAEVAAAIRRFEAAQDDAELLASIPFALAANQLKLTVSTGAIEIVGQALLVIGLDGYRNDSPASVGRHLRDVHSAALMIGNDRILASSAGLLGGYRGEEDLLA